MLMMHRKVGEAWVHSWRYHTRAVADATHPEERRQLMSGRYMREQAKRVRAEYEEALAVALEDYERRRREAERAPEAWGDHEIRQYFRSLSGEQRTRFLATAHEGKDTETLPALVNVTGVPERAAGRCIRSRAGPVLVDGGADRAWPAEWATDHDRRGTAGNEGTGQHVGATHDWTAIGFLEKGAVSPGEVAA